MNLKEKRLEVRKNITISQQRMWKNWATVEELSLIWEISKRRVQQIMVNLGISVEKQYLIKVEGTIETTTTMRPVFKLLVRNL